jgi:hypothetical protein
MIKKIVVLFSYFLSISCLAATTACPRAVPTNDPGFCASFKSVAECHCTSKGLPRSQCTNMKLLYDRMIAMFGSVRGACEFQRDTSTQDCIDDWNCYGTGGRDSQGRLCSSTGNYCEKLF